MKRMHVFGFRNVWKLTTQYLRFVVRNVAMEAVIHGQKIRVSRLSVRQIGRADGRLFTLLAMLVCATFFGTGIVMTEYKGNVTSAKAKALFNDLIEYKSNVNAAEAKMKEFAAENWDRKYAIAIINLYTQKSTFSSTLDYEMLNNYPNKTSDIWRRAGDLINRGLDILGPTAHKLLYMGFDMLSTSPVAGENFLFKQITRTSLSISNALAFKNCNNCILFRITDVYGISVAKYSYFPFEREVIIKPCNIFKVKKDPIKKKHYTVYYLDGQTDVNVINRECPWTEINTDRTSTEIVPNSTYVNGINRKLKRRVNGAYRTSAGVLPTCLTAMIMILILRQMLFDDS